LIGMACHGEGIGRYFFGNTAGQDAVSNLGLASAGLGLRLDPLPSRGMIAAWRHFRLTQLRSNFAYSTRGRIIPATPRSSRPAHPGR
jgi:hypothetical protein